MADFASRLKELRKAHKISQVSLAKVIGVTQQAISYYESGKDIPSLDVLLRLADFFDVSLDYLVGRSDDPRRR